MNGNKQYNHSEIGKKTNLIISETKVPKWSNDSVIYEVNIRQYTSEGTFKAFEEHLPRLKKMGVDILWFMPIHPISKEKRAGTLGSYYAVQDYKEINPEFGTIYDFKGLVNKAHKMGFKVLLDLVANHTGWDHVWIHNKSWYKQNSDGEIISPTAQGTTWHDVAQLNYQNEDMCLMMIDAMKFLVEETDIDGYRADYAGGVPVVFWEKARKALDEIKPVYMLAEDNTVYELLNQAFNSNYGWDLSHLMRDIAKQEKNAEDIKRYILSLEKLYPKGTYPMHWTSNHDDNSWEGTTYELFGDAEKVMAVLTFTLPGIPLIYSGQEAGLDKRLEFFEKDKINWNDLTMQSFYEDLIHLKKENPALWNGAEGGEIHFFDTSDVRILAFEREKGKSKVVVIMNLSSKKISATVSASSIEGRYRLFSSKSNFNFNEIETFDLGPWDYQIFIKS